MYSAVHTLLVFLVGRRAAASWPRFFAAVAVEDFLRTVLLHATNHQVFALRLTEQGRRRRLQLQMQSGLTEETWKYE